MNDPIFVLSATILRRLAGLFTLACLAGLSLYIVVSSTPFGLLTLVGAALFCGALCAFYFMYAGTQYGIELRDDGLFLSTGECLTPLENIGSIDRGTFSIKPANGFTVILKNKMAFSSCPGLYWRFGHKLGVGGVTHPQMAKVMAEMIQVKMSERDG